MARVLTRRSVAGEWDDLSTAERARVDRAERELVEELGLDPEQGHDLALLVLHVVTERDPGFDLIGRARSLARSGCEPALIYRVLR